LAPSGVQAFDPGARFRRFPLGPGVIGGLGASTPDGIWLGTYENGPGRLFRFTAATLAQLPEGETLGAPAVRPDHSSGVTACGFLSTGTAVGSTTRTTGGHTAFRQNSVRPMCSKPASIWACRSLVRRRPCSGSPGSGWKDGARAARSSGGCGAAALHMPHQGIL
jgi:hypothetical protein